ncbi:MAG: hypothetical protein K0S64_536 [Gaiellaceae bacterium]|nr:hypothetical protein [Gaiellaceae bacterium]
MATPDRSGRRTWRFRLSETETLEVSTPRRATEKQVRRRGRFGLVVGALVATVVFAAVGSADTLNTNEFSTTDDLVYGGGAQTVTITKPSSGTSTFNVSYTLQAQGGDSGPTGPGGNCNVSSTNPATLSFTGLPSGVTVTGGNSWTACGTQGVTFTVASSVVAGTYDPINPSLSGGSGTYNYHQHADFKLVINAPSVAAPTVTKNAVGSPNHVSGASTYVTSGTQLGFTVSSSAALSACTISIDGPTTNDASFSCVIGSNSYTLGGKLTSPPDGSYLNSASATNAGGTGSDSFTVILDNTAPSISVTGYTDGAVFVKGVDTLPTVGCSTADDGTGSGLASQSGPAVKAGTGLNANGVGSVTYQCTATDNLGNSRTVESTYSVIYNWSGFFSPVENPTAWNSAKAGQSIPVKFSLGGDEGLNIFASGYPKISSIACPNGGVTPDPIEEYETITANSKLIYDALAGQYNYVWKTDKAWAGKCFRLDVKLDDNTTHSANFQFTK